MIGASSYHRYNREWRGLNKLDSACPARVILLYFLEHCVGQNTYPGKIITGRKCS